MVRVKGTDRLELRNKLNASEHTKPMDIAQLNIDHGLTDQLKVVEGKGGFPFIEINNTRASAVISVYSGQVLSFRPKSEAQDVMFLSDKAYYQSGKAIKGGIPICWPWFGPDPDGLGRAAHGFVRNRMWNMVRSLTTADGDTQVTLSLSDTPETQSIWPQAFELILVVTVGESLTVELITRNQGDTPFMLTQALHTYFNVGDINQVQVLGLDGITFLDKTKGGVETMQVGAVTISQEVDRVYTNVAATELVIADISLDRRICITAQGSKTAIVWNPWVDITAGMADLEDADYQRLICVETANAADDIVAVAPGSEVRLVANYRVERG
jgi:glucose-6-phosphate 1-epimerase